MEPQPVGDLSTKYLVAMISFLAGALVTTDGFRFLLAQGLQIGSIVKVAICVALLAISAVVINRNNYWGNRQQQQLLLKLKLSGWQAFIAVGVLGFWIAVKLVLLALSRDGLHTLTLAAADGPGARWQYQWKSWPRRRMRR
jgi:hypothetical protein